jgi:iron complex transport system ATP-binding protein
MVGISHLLSKNIQHLSGGELQLVLITRALVQETPIILMDEPMSALDLGNQVKILKLIKELQRQKKTILFSSHNPNHALVLDANVCMIKDGQAIASGIASSCITQENLRTLYGDNVVLKATNDCNICILSLV